MNKMLYQDLVELIPESPEGLLQVVSKHANQKQTDDLLARFPKCGDKGSVSAKADELTVTKLRVEETLWGYGHKAAVEQDAGQFMQPNVFTYRSAIFPNPPNHSVTIRMLSAEPVECTGDERNPLYPWGLKLLMVVSGKGNRPRLWADRFRARARILMT